MLSYFTLLHTSTTFQEHIGVNKSSTNETSSLSKRLNKWEASLLGRRPMRLRERTLKQAVALAQIQNIEQDLLAHILLICPFFYNNAGKNRLR